jgi:hypothetical protein
LLNAIEKQPACAAPISSSGLVPLASSNRVWKDYCVSASTPLALEIVPWPDLRSPDQTADAVRFISFSLWVLRLYLSLIYYAGVSPERHSAMFSALPTARRRREAASRPHFDTMS